jgi:urease accessory protein
MIEERLLTVDVLVPYLESLLEESLLLEAVYCRTAHCFVNSNGSLKELNDSLSALRLARESREASVSLGRRFLKLVAVLDPSLKIREAGDLAELHFSIAFGYACGVLAFDADDTVCAFLHQNIVSLLSAAQRLLALGQMQSSRISWELKPLLAEAVRRSAGLDIHSVSSFSHLPELSSMRHPNLSTRLFIS